jgi:hypothetical protein
MSLADTFRDDADIALEPSLLPIVLVNGARIAGHEYHKPWSLPDSRPGSNGVLRIGARMPCETAFVLKEPLDMRVVAEGIKSFGSRPS